MISQPLLANTRTVVFDAYGTLFDVHSAVQRHAGAVGPDAARLSEIWRTKQLEYTWTLSLMGRRASFWALTEQALDFALVLHPAVDPDLRPQLLDAYRDLDAYPEVLATLRTLNERGVATAILSNGDTAMLARAVASAGLGDALDAVLSVDAAGTFKTHPDAYGLVLDRFGTSKEAILFCSSNRWDVAGAVAFGFASAWVNRRGGPDEYRDLAPLQTLANLDALL